MPEVRCPMCSKKNKEGLDVCAYCGARLRPLVVGRTSEDGAAGAPQDTTGEGEAPRESGKPGTDWLGRLRSVASASDEPQESTAGGPEDAPEWVDRLRPPERIGASEEAEQPFDLGDEPRTDWLGRLREVEDVTGAEEKDREAPEEDAPAEEEKLARAEIPGWLQVMQPEKDADVEGEEAEEGLEIVERLREEITEPGELEEDLEQAEEVSELPSELSMIAPEPGEREAALEEDEEILELRRKLAMHAPEPEEAEEALEEDLEKGEETLELRRKLAMHAPEPGGGEEGLEDDDEILELREKLARYDPAPGTLDEEIFEEGEDLQASPVEEPGLAAPATPALIVDDEDLQGQESDIDLEAIRVPEWVADEQAPGAADADTTGKPGIERAILPSWLEALRPIDSFRTQEEEEGEQPQSVETIGPLAGLSGVLMAEPLVAMPRTPGVIASGISITDQESEHARILRRLVEAERQDIAPSRPRLRTAPILHWFVAILLAAAVILPQFVSDSVFPAPRWVPQDLETLRTLVEGLPTDRPALLVVDYDPGYSAELEAVSSSLLDHLFQRSIPVVTLSTRATGPALAQRLVDHVSVWNPIEVGENYLHLGYLSGGPAAVQLFSTNPQYGNLRGFLLPEEREWTTPWQAPILSGVQRLSDFGVVVVVTAGTETARTWAEQAAPQTGETPFIMVLSAGAEPLVRPYYANPDRQVDAIFTGLPSAKANELLNGHTGDASLLWDSFGMGGWAAVGVLVVGGTAGLISSVLRGRAKAGRDA